MLLGRCERGQPARHQRVDQPPLHHRRDHGELFERILGGRVQATRPAEHRVGDRRRDAVAVPGREHLGDEERVARRHGEHLVGQVGAELTRALAEGGERDAVPAALRAELDWAGHPTILVVEDVHWADEATLDVLRFLARRIASCRPCWC